MRNVKEAGGCDTGHGQREGLGSTSRLTNLVPCIRTFSAVKIVHLMTNRCSVESFSEFVAKLARVLRVG